MAIPTDPLYASQWHFPLIGDIQTIWDEFDGTGVNVAVYDDGVEYTHADLSGNYNAALNLAGHDPFPIAGTDAHGTACAGIIGAAANNGLGGTGVAFGVGITGVDFLNEIQYQSAANITTAFQHAANFDVMSNSWGVTPAYGSYQSLLTASGSFFPNLFDYITTNGRGALGTSVIQASGNDNTNANADSTNATRFTTSIAATDASGNAASYTNFGSCILVAAPAAAVTTDRSGSDGYNTTAGAAGDYTTTFGGTSAATPVTAGIVALMNQANSGLGWRDVQNILATSAAQTGSAIGGAATGFEDGAWFTSTAGNWNGGGHSFHVDYGFGMVDAFAAVRMAEVWTTLFGGAATSANEQTVSGASGTVNLAIADLATTTSSIVVGSNIRIEDIMVTVNMQHSFSADVEMYLIAPDGTEYLLMADEGGSTLMDSGFNWTFGVTGALGMASAGTWTLRIFDDANADTGTLYDWNIDFYGATASPNDVYHFTDDYLTMLAHQAARGSITDANGGTDWLNFAAVAGNLAISLAGGAFSVAGVVWGSLTGGSVFENIVSGDGNDTLTGNGLANTMMGMRGDDVLNGGGGGDVLNGGAGTDTVSYEGSFGSMLVDLMFSGINTNVASGDTFVSIENLTGSQGWDNLRGTLGDNLIQGMANVDFIFGRRGDDTLDGGIGDDVLLGGVGADTLIGGAHRDRAQYSESLSAMVLDLQYANLNTGEAAGDTYNSIEDLAGGRFADRVSGDTGDNRLFGRRGNDVLYGRQGNDYLNGGANNDVLNGGAGNDVLRGGTHSDTFVFNAGADVIEDFADNTDTIQLEDALWGGGLTTAQILAMASVSGSDTVFDFGGGNTLTLQNFTDIAALADDILVF